MQLDYAATQTHQGKRGSGWQPGGWASSSNSFSVVQKAIWTGPWPFFTQSAFCVAALHYLLCPQLCATRGAAMNLGQIYMVQKILCLVKQKRGGGISAAILSV